MSKENPVRELNTCALPDCNKKVKTLRAQYCSVTHYKKSNVRNNYVNGHFAKK